MCVAASPFYLRAVIGRLLQSDLKFVMGERVTSYEEWIKVARHTIYLFL